MTEPPRIVSRYALYAEIAAGGMASVHFGRLLGAVGFSRPVAIKRLHAHHARDPQFTAMFIDEARLASRIFHPNVVSTLDIVQEDGELLLVMEYVQGESLSRLLRAAIDRNEPIPLRIAVAILTNVLHGLHAAHEAKSEEGQPLAIVHRDVSPQNVLVGIDGVARVLDFGVARARLRLEHTQEGRIKGKIAYMAPEQLGGSLVDRRADIYAASVVLWEALTGRRLWSKPEAELLLLDKALKAVDRPSLFREDVPDALDAITLHGLERDPDKRFATAREMALALEKYGPVATPSEVGAWVERMASESIRERAQQVSEFESVPPMTICAYQPGRGEALTVPEPLAKAKPILVGAWPRDMGSRALGLLPAADPEASEVPSLVRPANLAPVGVVERPHRPRFESAWGRETRHQPLASLLEPAPTLPPPSPKRRRALAAATSLVAGFAAAFAIWSSRPEAVTDTPHTRGYRRVSAALPASIATIPAPPLPITKSPCAAGLVLAPGRSDAGAPGSATEGPCVLAGTQVPTP